MTTNIHRQLPETGFLRLRDILGDADAAPPIPALIPIAQSTWWEGIPTGRFPPPVRTLGKRISAWRVEDIRALILAMGQETTRPTDHKRSTTVISQPVEPRDGQPNAHGTGASEGIALHPAKSLSPAQGAKR